MFGTDRRRGKKQVSGASKLDASGWWSSLTSDGNSPMRGKLRADGTLQPWLATHIVLVPRRKQPATQDVFVSKSELPLRYVVANET